MTWMKRIFACSEMRVRVEDARRSPPAVSRGETQSKLRRFSGLRRISVLAILLGSVVTARAATLPDGMWAAKPGTFKLTYHLVHPLHHVDGVSTVAEGMAKITPQGVQVEARAPVKSFVSGSANRDSNMQTVVDEAKYPYVLFKGVGPVCQLVNGSCNIVLQGQVTFHGVTKPYSVPVVVQHVTGNQFDISFSFAISLEGHQIKRPSLLLMPIEDRMVVDGQAVMELAK